MTTPTDEARRVLTFDETAEELRVSRSTLFRLIDAGELRSFTIGRSRRFLHADVDAFLRRRIEEQDVSEAMPS